MSTPAGGASKWTGVWTTERIAAMRFDVITLFPELVEPHTRSGVTRRAYDSGAIELKLWQLRDHADDAYRRVDDRPFGGGPGMVMLAEPLQRALAAVRAGAGDCSINGSWSMLATTAGSVENERFGRSSG